MSAPLYQTGVHLTAEADTALQFFAAHQAEGERHPDPNHSFDWYWLHHVTRRRCGQFEIKNRSHFYGQFDTIILSKSKADSILQEGAEAYPNPLRSFFVVGWKDKIGVTCITEHWHEWEVKLAGRYDRPTDSKAIEPCYHIPLAHFTNIIARIR